MTSSIHNFLDRMRAHSRERGHFCMGQYSFFYQKHNFTSARLTGQVKECINYDGSAVLIIYAPEQWSKTKGLIGAATIVNAKMLIFRPRV